MNDTQKIDYLKFLVAQYREEGDLSDYIKAEWADDFASTIERLCSGDDAGHPSPEDLDRQLFDAAIAAEEVKG